MNASVRTTMNDSLPGLPSSLLTALTLRWHPSGPQVNTFELTGDQVSYDAEESASTKSSSAKVTAKVTDVIEQ